jgi:hypothetical protein
VSSDWSSPRSPLRERESFSNGPHSSLLKNSLSNTESTKRTTTTLTCLVRLLERFCMSMNLDKESSHSKTSDKESRPERLGSLRMTLEKATKMILMEDGTKENRKRPKNGNLSIEEYRWAGQFPPMRRQRRILGLKNHASLSQAQSKDICYKTVHPKNLDVKKILELEKKSNKKSKLEEELSKQEHMIKRQQNCSLTKKYKLLHSDLGILLRSTSDGAVCSPVDRRDDTTRIVMPASV